MGISRRACTACGAMNAAEAAWCGGCYRRFAPEATPVAAVDAGAAVALPVGGVTMPPHLRELGRIAVLLVILGVLVSRLFQPGSLLGGDPFVEGTYDERGFRPLFVDAETSAPVHFNACEPVHYVINPESAPAGAVDDAHRAFELLGQATGMTFVFDGTTDERFGTERDPHQPERYGDRWAPILISWSSAPLHFDAAETGESGDAIGLGGGTIRLNDQGRPVYVSGAAVFDASDELASGYGGVTWGQVMLHELGHVVGLDHVEDHDSVMYPGMGLRPAAFGAGDRAGLWELGIGASCIESPTP